MNRRLIFTSVLVVELLASVMAFAQTTRERGFGPYTISTQRGEITARILRREGDMIWVDRQVQSGNWVETGLPKSEIITFQSSRPGEFLAADRATTPGQIGPAIDGLRRFVALRRPYRDLPGFGVDEALLLHAQLNERRSSWRDALQLYEDVLSQTYEIANRQQIRYRAGLCLWRMDQKEKALNYLLDDPIPEEDLDLWSAVAHARADSLAAVNRHREAIDGYLNMIVFHPYEQSNEVRALSAIIPSYIALADWDAVTKTLAALKTDYPEAAETKAAEELLAKYPDQLESEKQFQITEE